MSPNTNRTNNSGSRSNSVFYTLLEKMQSLSFLPFQMCVLLWLGSKGFRSVRPLGRIHRRGRRGNGGADFLAKPPGLEVDVAIQVRHWRTPLQGRAVDELWGFMLRNKVPLGLIICGSGILESAERTASEYPGRPVQLVSCRQLCSSMAELELGVVKPKDKWLVDEGFFRSVHKLAFASAMSVAAPGGMASRLIESALTRRGLDKEPSEPAHTARPYRKWIVACAAALLAIIVLWLWLGGAR